MLEANQSSISDEVKHSITVCATIGIGAGMVMGASSVEALFLHDLIQQLPGSTAAEMHQTFHQLISKIEEAAEKGEDPIGALRIFTGAAAGVASGLTAGTLLAPFYLALRKAVKRISK